MGFKDKFKSLGKTVYSEATDFGYGFYSNVNDIKMGVESKLEERDLRMEKARTLEDMLSEVGSSIIPFRICTSRRLSYPSLCPMA